MSRIGRLPIVVPEKVKVTLADATVHVEGPNGKLSFTPRPEIKVQIDDAGRQVRVERADDERLSRSLHGLSRSLIANMVKGVSEGYTKKLEIVGVGFQAQMKGPDTLALQVGFANQVLMKAPAGIKVSLTDPTHVTITGADKQAVGQFAAEVRAVRPPEPYKGKGIRYEGEAVRRKSGKAFGK
jgi:large subunit ribosomal protein L6